jgi:hypothetical protein
VKAKPGIHKLVTVATALCLLAAGCATHSVHPIYTSKDLIFDPSLIGRWAETDSTGTFWKFDDVDGKSYMVTVTDNESESTNSLEANLFQLKQYRFLDLLDTGRDKSFEKMPLHLIAEVGPNNGTNLSLHFLDYTSDNMHLTADGARHHLTGDTKGLQKFLLNLADDTNSLSPDTAVELKFVSH